MPFRLALVVVAAVMVLAPRASADPAPRSRAMISDLVLRDAGGARVLEVDVPGLPDTAMAEMTRLGPMILYNPELYRAAGPAREFVRAHEYAHVTLTHLSDPHYFATDEGHAEAEAEADCFAARRASALSVMAMVRLLRRRPPEARDGIYGTKAERVRRILACAGMAQG